jgi:hypothetical protein
VEQLTKLAAKLGPHLIQELTNFSLGLEMQRCMYLSARWHDEQYIGHTGSAPFAHAFFV